MTTEAKAYLLGGGIRSLSAAACMIRDGDMPGKNITILESGAILGGSLDGAADATAGHSLRGGRMLTTDNYECLAVEARPPPSQTDNAGSLRKAPRQACVPGRRAGKRSWNSCAFSRNSSARPAGSG
jgi:oleate hydratase